MILRATSILLFILLGFTYNGLSQIVSFELSKDGSPNIINQNIYVSDFIAGPGLANITYNSAGAYSNNWTTGDLDNSDFYQIYLVPKKGYSLIINEISFEERRSGTGVLTYEIRWSNRSDFKPFTSISKVDLPDNANDRIALLKNLNINPLGNDSIFIRWYGYNAKSNSGTWRINSNSLIISGIVENLVAIEKRFIISPTTNQIPDKEISSLSNSPGSAVEILKFNMIDVNPTDSISTSLEQIKLCAGTFNNANWVDLIQGVIVKNSNQIVSTGKLTIKNNSILIPIKPDDISIKDGEEANISISIFLNQKKIKDHSILQFRIDSLCNDWKIYSGKSVITGGFTKNSIESGIFKISVRATQLVFNEIPSIVNVNNSFFAEVVAVDDVGNNDIDMEGRVSLNLAGGKGRLTSVNGLSQDMYLGKCRWDNLNYDSQDKFILSANYIKLPFAVSKEIVVADHDSKVEIIHSAINDSVISSLACNPQKAINILFLTIIDNGSKDSLPTIINEIKVSNTFPTNGADWTKIIGGVIIKDGTKEIPIKSLLIKKEYIVVSLNQGVLTIPNKSSKELIISFYLNSENIKDNTYLQFYIDTDHHSWKTGEGSSLLSDDFGYDLFSNLYRIDVTADRLFIGKFPFLYSCGSNFNTIIYTCDENYNIDYGSNLTAKISKASGNGTLFSGKGLISEINSGIGNFTELNCSSTEPFILKAESEGLISAKSDTVLVSREIFTYLNEDFENSNLQDWLNISDWKVSSFLAISGVNSLKHNLSEIDGESYISHHLKNLVLNSSATHWKFTIKNGDWSPSSENYFLVWLASNEANLTSSIVDGYAIGLYQKKDGSYLSLLKISDGKIIKPVIETLFNWINGEIVNIEVLRNYKGEWKLKYDKSGENTFYSKTYRGIDNEFASADYFGISFYYTSTRAGRIWLDNIEINSMEEENVEAESAPLAKFGDIVINEIMPDPTPSVSIPEFEYIELYNNTTHPICLTDWTIVANNLAYKINRCRIEAKEFMIVTSVKAEADMNKYGNIITLENFPVLNNEGQLITLYSKEKELISFVNYKANWIEDPFKESGGWSFERIDPVNPSGVRDNWKSSVYPLGGTPGRQNSVYESNSDFSQPFLKSVGVLNNQTLTLSFSEPIDYSITKKIDFIRIENDLINTFEVSSDLTFQNFVIKFDKYFKEGKIYNLILSNLITDLSSNPIKNTSYRFAVPLAPEENDIVFNEILYNPGPFGTSFIEIINRSNRSIDLKEIKLGVKEIKSTKYYNISEGSFLILPGDIVLITNDISKLQKNYLIPKTISFIEMNDFPSLNRTEGRILLITKSEKVIDDLSYSEKMQFPLLSRTDGVSLERISADSPTYEKSNWHSAAENIGFATPGYENSQNLQTIEIKEEVNVSPEIFSPDNDGKNDFLSINYSFEEPGYVANVTVYDAKGKFVRQIANNELVGLRGNFTWDGIDAENTKSRIGIYIVYVEVFHLRGKVKRFKKTCVLAERL